MRKLFHFAVLSDSIRLIKMECLKIGVTDSVRVLFTINTFLSAELKTQLWSSQPRWLPNYSAYGLFQLQILSNKP